MVFILASFKKGMSQVNLVCLLQVCILNNVSFWNATAKHEPANLKRNAILGQPIKSKRRCYHRSGPIARGWQWSKRIPAVCHPKNFVSTLINGVISSLSLDCHNNLIQANTGGRKIA